MRKATAILTAILIILFLPVTAFAATTTISVEVPEPSYQLNIPSDMTIAYKDASCSLSVPTVSCASDFKEGMGLKVSVSYSGVFTCEGVATTIPFSFAMIVGGTVQAWTSGNCLYFDRTEDGGIISNGRTETGTVPTAMALSITDAAWDAAFPGRYTTSITYMSSYTTAD